MGGEDFLSSLMFDVREAHFCLRLGGRLPNDY